MSAAFAVEHFKGTQYRRANVPVCDLAFPSATQNEIGEDDARTLVANGCYCVSEGANMPSRPEAVDVFHEAKILYGPGKAANAGGVAVSGLEMTQNGGCMRRSRDDVDNQLHAIMTSIHQNCVKCQGERERLRGLRPRAPTQRLCQVADAMVAHCGYM
jgi:glutamate dehydrogenase/leucine dehydrogenase